MRKPVIPPVIEGGEQLAWPLFGISAGTGESGAKEGPEERDGGESQSPRKGHPQQVRPSDEGSADLFAIGGATGGNRERQSVGTSPPADVRTAGDRFG